MNMHEQHIANISPNKLKVDFSYQRNALPSKINKIVKNFNMDLFNPPKVSHRSDGYYWIFDGQHSMLAHKKVFGDETPINCKIYEGLTYDEEVELFVQQNGICTQVSTNDKLRAEYSKANSDVRNMIEAAELVGIIIDFNNNYTPNHINATATAYSIWKLLGKDDFINVLKVIKEAWNGDPESLTSGFLKGLAYIYKHYGQAIQNKNMIEMIRKNTPLSYHRKAKDIHGSVMIKYATVFIEAYNYRKKNKLEEPGRK